jgi:hypothetical protein
VWSEIAGNKKDGSTNVLSNDSQKGPKYVAIA